MTQKHNSGFIENKGQIIDQNNNLNPDVLYLLNTPGMNVQLRRGGWSYDVYSISHEVSGMSQEAQGMSHEEMAQGSGYSSQHPGSSNQDPESSIRYHRIDFDLIGANPDCKIITSELSEDYLNYYTAGTPAEGITGVRSFQAITYKNIYPGIDMQCTAPEDVPFKYNFILAPGTDPSVIRIRITGPDQVQAIRDGIRYQTDIGALDEAIPNCYYQMNGSRFACKAVFYRISDHTYGIRIRQPIPSDAMVLIDPVPTRRWGTYYAGTCNEYASMNSVCTVDPTGNAYLCGSTCSTTNIATSGAFQTTLVGNQDGFLVKFSPEGLRLWATYYGGNYGANFYTCTTDRDGNIIAGGATGSTENIATPGAHQTVKHGDGDGFLVKFDPSGIRLWGSYYGGNELITNGWEGCFSLAADTLQCIYMAGGTSSPDYISTPGSVQPGIGGNYDAFLVKFTPDGQREWGTYYGGTNMESQDVECTVSKNGYVYLAGTTRSPDQIATPGSFLPVFSGMYKGFLACFDLSGQRLWGTYFGGEDNDGVNGCAHDTGSCVYLFGLAGSQTNIATPGVFQPASIFYGGPFLEKFSESGERLWGTYYGGDYADHVLNATVNDSGYVYIAGITMTQSSFLVSPGSYQPVFQGDEDIFLAKLNGEGQRIWGTYYGGTSADVGPSCATDHADHIYLSGITYSGNQPSLITDPCLRDPNANHIATPGSHQFEPAGMADAFLVKFANCQSPDTASQIYGPDTLCADSQGRSFSIDPIPSATGYQWCVSGNLTIVSGQNTTNITVSTGPEQSTDTISVYGRNACADGFPISRVILVQPRPVPEITGSDTICTGDTTVFFTEPGMRNYIWTVSPGGTIVTGGSGTDTLISVVWSTGGSHWVSVGYEASGCPSLQPTLKPVWVNAGPAVEIAISSSANPVCSGSMVTFEANPVNPGSVPVYQWKVNGIDTGTNNPFYSYTPADGDTVQCVLTSNLPCVSGNPAVSNQVIMTVEPYLLVDVSISASENPVCEGTSVSVSALPVNGGLNPVYQWFLNGFVAGNNDPVFSYIPADGDILTCTMISSALCTAGNPAVSPPVIMTVYPFLPVSINIAAGINPVCSGLPVTFTGAAIHGGSTPAFQWQVNGINAGINNAVFTYTPENGDIVSCVLTSSEPCTSGNPVSANPITMTVVEAPEVTFIPCFDTITTTNAKPILLRGGIPMGGVFSGTGVESVVSVESGIKYYFDPALAGTGIHEITYNYINSAGCRDSARLSIINYQLSIHPCGTPMLDIRDSTLYPTVQIGPQCWFAANLDYGTEIANTIPQRDNCIPEKYSSHQSPVTSHSFYQWDELMCYQEAEALQGLCPPGWHVPSESDWNALFATWTNSAFAGEPLKYTGYSGFNAFLNGAGFFNKGWWFGDFASFFWSSTSHGPYKAWAHGMHEVNYSVSYYPGYRANAFPVRCTRD